MVSLTIINKSYELYKHFSEVNNHLIKRWRLTIGQSTEQSVLALLELTLANETRIFQLQSETQEIGRMLGGGLVKICAKPVVL